MPIETTRAVTRGTRQNLVQGVRARPMPAHAVNAILAQATVFASDLVDLYERDIALGEVGATGSARATEEPILAQRAPTALMYGRVQSGKTAAMILTTALCIDNGFRVIVVLTADNVALVRQTADRFRDLDGPMVFSSVKEDGYGWEGQEAEIRADVANDGIVLVCAKDAFHLPQIIRFLQQIEAPSYPTLVFDDEADAATPDTTIAARTSGRPNAPAHASTINRRVIQNTRPGEEGESIGEMFTHRLYVQVTATPYILFLQRRDSALRPNRTFLLGPGAGYCGGEIFFGEYDPSSNLMPDPPVAILPANEALAIGRLAVPSGLAASIEFFLLASLAAAARAGRYPEKGYKHLSHSSPRIDQHTVVAGHIASHLHEIRRELRERPAEALTRFAPAYAELRRTWPTVASLNTLIVTLPEVIRQAEVRVVNSATDIPSYGPRVNFMVGGNILGRGLTIDDLLVTYYVREAQVSQMDTVWQHARMYGYRRDDLPFTRLYVPRRVAARFKSIHETEEHLRGLLAREAAGETVPIRVARGTRPTRPNAIEGDSVTVIPARQAQIHPVQAADDPASAAALLAALQRAHVPIDVPRDQRATQVPIDQALAIIDAVPVMDGDTGSWQPGIVGALVEDYRPEMNGSIVVYVRELDGSPSRIRGRLSGDEINIIRAAAGQAPALAMLFVGNAAAPRGWYPTLVMPADAPTFFLAPE